MSAHHTRRRRAASVNGTDDAATAATSASIVKISTQHNPRQSYGEYAPHENAPDNLRKAIAQGAARLIAEGLDDYHAAKQKATRQLGLNSSDKNCLPDNHEIEAALREHLMLFASDAQPAALTALREAAMQAMQWLSDFSPWLTGAVLAGTANEFSAIELELIGVEAKSFEMFLLGADVKFNIREHHRSLQPPHRGHNRRRSFKPHAATFDFLYEIIFDDVPIEITLYDSHAERQARYPHSSIKHDRAQLFDVIRRFDVV
ncbi:MAG: hypothetical protein WCL29_00005 [Pseudomonadota bacterium]